MMKTSLSKHEKMMASKSWRMANASNSREEQNLQKEKQRLMKQYEAETCQLKAAQNRFENQYRKKSTTEKKTSLVLPPLQEKNSHPLKGQDGRKGSCGNSVSLPSLPRSADSFSVIAAVPRPRSVSVSSEADSHSASLIVSDSHKGIASTQHHRRSKSYAGLPNVIK